MAESKLHALMEKALGLLMKRDPPPSLRVMYKVYTTLDKASKRVKDVIEYEDELTRRIAQKDISNVAFKHCDNELIKKLYEVTDDLTDITVDLARETPRDAAEWRKSLSKSIWGPNALPGYGEFGPTRAPGEPLNSWYNRRALGARNALSGIDDMVKRLWAFQDYFSSVADIGSHANELGIALAVPQESSVPYSCGMLIDEMGKKAKAANEKAYKILSSMDGLIPSLQELTATYDDGLNSLGPRADLDPSSGDVGPGKFKDVGPPGR